MEVKLSDGSIVELRKPKAGMRNDAAIKAETKDGFKQTMFMMELLPHCIAKHGWGTIPIRTALGNLSIEDYDTLVDGLSELMKPKGDVEKKSEPSLEGAG